MVAPLKTAVQICRFYVFQLYRKQPVVVAAMGLSLLAVLISGAAWAVMLDARQTVAQDLSAIAAARAANSAKSASAGVLASARPDLPVFSSSALTADFHAISADVKLPIDEVSYSLDGSASQPYLRYRVTLAVKTGYPEIRKFAAALVGALPNVALDSVRCGKEDAVATGLSCQLVFSAFYQKSGRG